MTWWPTASDGASRTAKERWIYEWRNVIHIGADRRDRRAALARPRATRTGSRRERQSRARDRGVFFQRPGDRPRAVREQAGPDGGNFLAPPRREKAVLHRAVQQSSGGC